METLFKLDEISPSLREAFGEDLPNPAKIILVAVPVKDLRRHKELIPSGKDRSEIALVHGEKTCFWDVTSLRELFRGDKQPPLLGDYPEFYNDSFTMLDAHVVEISRFFGDPRDQEMEEIFAQLRKRPDGKSLGFVHDYMWQACALVLGTHVLSQAEFEAIMARLERSCRRFGQGSTSRNMARTLRMLHDQHRT